MKWKEQNRNLGGARWAAAVPTRVFNDARAATSFADDDVAKLFAEINGHLKAANLNKTDALNWPVFMCHIARPLDVPIYDVNVWVAWGVLAEWMTPDLLRLRPTEFSTYLEYRDWFNDLVTRHGVDHRELDRALMAFGQFVTSPLGRALMPIR